MLLQQPGKLGHLTLKNRVVMAPLGTNFSTSDGLITERDKAYYAERALGGVAMIMTSAMGVTGQARSHRNTPVCTGLEANAQGIREFAPDLVVVATGASPKPSPVDLAGVSSAIKVCQAWDVLRAPAALPPATMQW